MAYNAVTVTANQPLPDGLVHLQVRFTGNAGEPAVTKERDFGASATLITVRQWVISEVNELNGRRTLSALAGLAVGQTLDLTAIAPPAPTAKEQWFIDLGRLQRVQEAITAGVLTTAFDDTAVTSLVNRVASIPIVLGDF